MIFQSATREERDRHATERFETCWNNHPDAVTLVDGGTAALTKHHCAECRLTHYEDIRAQYRWYQEDE